MVAEKYEPVKYTKSAISATGGGGTQPKGLDGFLGEQQLPYQGGNRLIVAALAQDWERIKDLLKQIDVPTRTVIFDGLIFDAQVADDKSVGGSFRNPQAIGVTAGHSIQAAHIAAQPVNTNQVDALVYDATGAPPSQQVVGDLAVDLLKIWYKIRVEHLHHL